LGETANRELAEAERGRKPVKTKRTNYVYTIITPDGIEIVLGAYVSDKSAKSACKRLFAADWLALSSGPLQQRVVLPGEKVKRGIHWTAAHELLPVAGELKTQIG
jgi:hypothetical protein